MTYNFEDVTRTLRTKIDADPTCADCDGNGCQFCSGTGTGCWVFGGAVDRYGYGSARLKGRTFIVHRFVYDRLVGPIPDGMDLDHLCRQTRRCCNPAHLEPVEPSENSRRANQRRWHGDQ